MTTVALEGRRDFVDWSSAVFAIFVLLAGYGLTKILPIVLSRIFAYPGPGLMSVLVWSVYAAILLVFLYRLELFERRSTVTIAGAFIWGAVVVTGVGVTASPAMAEIVSSWLGEDRADWVPAVAAPLVEEPLKALGILALAMIPGARINSALDGLFYGLIVGLGFEVVESLLYTVDAVASQGGVYSAVFSVFLLRGVVGGLWSHPTFSGVAGAGVGYYFGSERGLIRRLGALVGALLLAIALHALFNAPLFGESPVLGAIVRGVPALVIFVVTWRLARRDEQQRFAHAAVGEIDPSLLSDSERTGLLRRTSRKRAVREMSDTGGIAAAAALEQLQRAQIDMIEEAIYEGVDSEDFARAANEVRSARESLADLV